MSTTPAPPRPRHAAEVCRRVSIAVNLCGSALQLAAFVRLTGGLGALIIGVPFLLLGQAPFALALHGLRKPTATLARALALVIPGGFGLFIYGHLVLTNDLWSTVGLVLLFCPLWQLLGCWVAFALPGDKQSRTPEDSSVDVPRAGPG
jgi:hypothetical protein